MFCEAVDSKAHIDVCGQVLDSELKGLIAELLGFEKDVFPGERLYDHVVFYLKYRI